MSNKIILLLLILLVIPIVYAAEEEEKCGITNLASCIPEKFYKFTLKIINAPLQPYLNIIKDLLSEPVNIDNFASLWAVIVYIISIFYGLFIIVAGFNLMVSGYSAERRNRAKSWLKNVLLMIVFVQASFYLYSLILEMSSSLTAGIINMIDQNFFLLTIDNLPNMALELSFGIPYLITLSTTIIFLSLRYLLVAVGVVFFPIGLFLNFIPPLKAYGKFIINCLLCMVFITFIQGLILLAASKLIEVGIFANFKIIIMITSFTLVNLVMILLLLFTALKAVMSVYNSDTARSVRVIHHNTNTRSNSDPNAYKGVKYNWNYY